MDRILIADGGFERAGRRVLAGLCIALLTACGQSGEAAPPNAQAAGGRGGGRGGAPTGPTPVEVSSASLAAIARAVTVTGTVEPIRTVGVNSQLAGALLAVDVQEGDLVTTGSVLARIDQRELEAQLASAQASFQVAEAAAERAEQLRERQVITLPEYERDRTALAAARAQLDQLTTRIGFATVRSPIDGVVTAKLVEQGDVVGNQTRMFTVADISTLVVRVGVSELDVVQLSEGRTAEVSLDAFPGARLTGRIRRVFPSADPTTRLVPVEVALEPSADRVVRPGFLARVRFEVSSNAEVLMVPSSAVVGIGGVQAVFVVDGERVLQRIVQTGPTSEGRVVVLSGLEEGERIVVAGNNTLRDGAEINIVDQAAAASPDATSSAPTETVPAGESN